MIVSTIDDARVEAKIVETEAYLGHDDPASHAYRGRRHPGNAKIYSPPGTWYVYLSYGMHWCANIVTGPLGLGAAVLLRAVTVTKGLDVVKRRRGLVDPRQLTNGPGKLGSALGIDRGLDGLPMQGSRVVIHAARPRVRSVITTPRIGITKAVDWPLRFVVLPEDDGGGPAKSRPRRRKPASDDQ